jgi:hypothetical protein
MTTKAELEKEFETLAGNPCFTPIQSAFIIELGRELYKGIVIKRVYPGIWTTVVNSGQLTAQYLGQIQPMIHGVATKVHAGAIYPATEFGSGFDIHTNRISTIINDASAAHHSRGG